MKYNLKNRPKSCCGTIDYLPEEAECQVWFDGFQKELQEWYDQCIVDGVIPHSPVFILIEEILGE